jgi:hypothetical protein
VYSRAEIRSAPETPVLTLMFSIFTVPRGPKYILLLSFIFSKIGLNYVRGWEAGKLGSREAGKLGSREESKLMSS